MVTSGVAIMTYSTKLNRGHQAFDLLSVFSLPVAAPSESGESGTLIEESFVFMVSYLLELVA